MFAKMKNNKALEKLENLRDIKANHKTIFSSKKKIESKNYSKGKTNKKIYSIKNN